MDFMNLSDTSLDAPDQSCIVDVVNISSDTKVMISKFIQLRIAYLKK